MIYNQNYAKSVNLAGSYSKTLRLVNASSERSDMEFYQSNNVISKFKLARGHFININKKSFKSIQQKIMMSISACPKCDICLTYQERLSCLSSPRIFAMRGELYFIDACLNNHFFRDAEHFIAFANLVRNIEI